MEIILVIILIIIFLLYLKLSKLILFIEEKSVPKEVDKDNSFQNWLYEDLSVLKEKISVLSDYLTIEDSAWGENSSSIKKRDNLVKLYSEYLVVNEEISKKDATCKAQFIIDNFNDQIINEIRRSIAFDRKIKSEKELVMSDYFKEEVARKKETLKPIEVFKPVYLGVTKRKYKIGDELFQNTERAFDAYSGDYGYECYVEDMAIISKLEELGILGVKVNDAYTMLESQNRSKLGVTFNASLAEIKNKYVELAKKYHPDSTNGDIKKFTEVTKAYKSLIQKKETPETMSGHLFYILREDDVDKMRDKIFDSNKDEAAYYNDEYFEQYADDENYKLPFKKQFEY